MDPSTFYQRLAICHTCPFWRGACTQGHPLHDAAGCPDRRFAPLEGAAYFVPGSTKLYTKPEKSPCAGCAEGGVAEKPLTWAQATVQFGESMRRALEAGWPLLEGKDYTDRLVICRACDRYWFFQCQDCRCLVWFKAKLATETCPRQRWPLVKGHG